MSPLPPRRSSGPPRRFDGPPPDRRGSPGGGRPDGATLPLPRATVQALEQAGGVAACANLSLALNRFVDAWQPAFADRDTRREKSFLQACQRIAEQRPSRALLDDYHTRQRAQVRAGDDMSDPAAIVRARLARRLVIGLGIANPLEVNLALHRVGGFPYVPGSSVKGAARATAEELERRDSPLVLAAFGPPPGADHHAQGALTFFDALPEAGYHLALEVMTPHHSAYYTGDEPPADWQSPNPILFLAVERGAVFRFPVTSRRRLGADGRLERPEAVERRLSQALEWLREALRDGLGGKRSAGYGAFEMIEVLR